MKLIKLSQDKYVQVDDSDFDLLNQFKWCCSTTGYAVREATNKTIYMHRFIMGEPKGMQVDHKNLNTFDCQRHNLRIVTYNQNQWNRPRQHNNTSGHKGVGWNKQVGRWRARIKHLGIVYQLGNFNTKTEAAAVYAAASHSLHGEFGRIS